MTRHMCRSNFPINKHIFMKHVPFHGHVLAFATARWIDVLLVGFTTHIGTVIVPVYYSVHVSIAHAVSYQDDLQHNIIYCHESTNGKSVTRISTKNVNKLNWNIGQLSTRISAFSQIKTTCGSLPYNQHAIHLIMFTIILRERFKYWVMVFKIFGFNFWHTQSHRRMLERFHIWYLCLGISRLNYPQVGKNDNLEGNEGSINICIDKTIPPKSILTYLWLYSPFQ